VDARRSLEAALARGRRWTEAPGPDASALRLWVEPYRLVLARIGLPAYFIITDFLWVTRPGTLAVDAIHYQRAANAWLAGGDPWKVEYANVSYAAGPHTLLFYAPTSLLSAEASAIVWMGLGLLAAIWVTRMMGVPLWWVAFPPLAHAVWNGNPQAIVLALLVFGGPIAGSLAMGLKLYAGVVLLAKPRVLLIAIVVLLVTLPLLPWRMYVDDNFGFSAVLSPGWNGSAWRVPLLVPPTLLALWILRRKGAEWWAVPAVWPSIQYYYVSMAMPMVVRRPILAALIATPAVLVTPVVVMGLAVMTVLERRRTPAPNATASSTDGLPGGPVLGVDHRT
jgi:hypothetical protein